MLLWLENHRDLNHFQFIFKAPEAINVSEVKSQFEKKFLKGIDSIPRDKKAQEAYIRDQFDKKYGPDKYETAFRKVAQKYVTNATVRERLIAESTMRYRDKYTKLREKLAQSLKKRLDVRNEAISGIRKNTRKNLDTLLEAVKRGNHVDRMRATIETGKVDRGAATRFLHGLNDQYFNLALTNNASRTPQKMKRYRLMFGKFKAGMRTFLDKSIDHIERTTKDPAKRKIKIQQLLRKIEAYYKQVAGNDGLMDFDDAERLHQKAEKMLKMQNKLSKLNNREGAIKFLEMLQKLDPTSLKKGVLVMMSQIERDARQNGTEHHIVKYAEKLTGKKNLSFYSATHQIKQVILDKIAIDARGGYALIEGLSKAAYQQKGEILDMNEYKPKGIRILARRERQRLLSRKLIPENPMDKTVVEFVSADRKGRILLLKKPLFRKKLLQSIRDITHHYPKTYRKHFKSIRRLKKITYSRNLSSPNSNDKAARLIALITIAKEAEWHVKQLDQTKDFKGKGIAATLDRMGYRKASPQINLRFFNPSKLRASGYTTAAARGGFNGRDILLSGAKFLAGVTILMNYMNYRRDLGWVGGLEASLSNPYMYLAAGSIYGIHKFQKNPEYKNYFLETAGGQAMIQTHTQLSSLKKKWGPGGENQVLGFVHNANEFDAMHKIMEKPKGGARKLARLLAKKQKLAKNGKPTLSREDLKNLIGNDNIYYRLPSKDAKNDRFRFLFYSRFLTKARSTHELQSHCLSWPKKVIS